MVRYVHIRLVKVFTGKMSWKTVLKKGIEFDPIIQILRMYPPSIITNATTLAIKIICKVVYKIRILEIPWRHRHCPTLQTERVPLIWAAQGLVCTVSLTEEPTSEPTELGRQDCRRLLLFFPEVQQFFKNKCFPDCYMPLIDYQSDRLFILSRFIVVLWGPSKSSTPDQKPVILLPNTDFHK